MSVLIGGALLAGIAAAHTTLACPCRYAGGVAPQGAVICLDVAGKRSLARCEMVLNNSSWRFLDQPCPIASPAVPERRDAVQRSPRLIIDNPGPGSAADPTSPRWHLLYARSGQLD
jgi:hypothetical protein